MVPVTRGFDMRVFILAAVLFLAPATAYAQNSATEASVRKFWSEGESEFLAAGITKPMFRAYFYWMEQQYLLGVCENHYKEESVLYWRTWWKNTVLEKSDVGRTLLLKAGDLFNRGVEDRLKNPIPRSACLKIMADWVAQMRAVQREK